MIPSRETFKPGCFASLVLGMNSEIKLADEFVDKTVVFWNTIQGSNDCACFLASASPNEVARRFWEKEDA
jgi:hypothetical protein